VEWRGFQLRPEAPPEGLRLSQLYGPRADAMRAHAERFAQGFGVTGMKTSDHLPNTLSALALAEWARDQGKLEPFQARVMDAYWSQGQDIGDPEVLVRLAQDAGLSAEEARRALKAPEYTARVAATRQEASRAGVSGVPAFFIGGARVVGCQPYEVLAEAARLAGARPRR
jgi:predicted DsbA family dithiol-disulfide isomerase